VNSGPPKCPQDHQQIEERVRRSDPGHDATRRPRVRSFRSSISVSASAPRPTTASGCTPNIAAISAAATVVLLTPTSPRATTAPPAASCRVAARGRAGLYSLALRQRPADSPRHSRYLVLGREAQRRCVQHDRGPSETGGPSSRPPSISLYGPAQSAAPDRVAPAATPLCGAPATVSS
jgi:hypothetical protein